MYKILIVEDDVTISKAIKKHIEAWGWEAANITDFKEVLSQFSSYNPQLVLLDISLPFYNGYYWCTEIRKISKVPIIFLSSASDNMNIVMAMNMGGDDYVIKPFDLNVLTAKIQAMLRRTYNFNDQTDIYEHNGVILNNSDNCLYYNENKIELSKNEYKIMRLLMKNNGKVISRSTIMMCLWETDCYIDDNTLTVNMSRLRKKLECYDLAQFITTKKGSGYIIE